MAPFGLYLAFHLYRSGLLQKALRQVPLILLAVSPVLIQLLIWAAAAGGGIPKTPEEIGYIEKERFFWTQPVLLLPLFSSLQGLFFYSPILLWSAWGLAWGTLQRGVWRDPLFLCLVCSALALWYINGCWYAWWFGGDAFGARAFLELGGLYILGFAFALDHLRKCSFRARVPIATAATCAILVGYGLMGTRAINVMPSRTDTFLFAWERERFAHTLARARLERPSNASSELPSR